MAAFTIFHNTRTGEYTAIYDFNIPSQTGVGVKEEWQPVFHGEATGLLDKARQCKEFAAKHKEAIK